MYVVIATMEMRDGRDGAGEQCFDREAYTVAVTETVEECTRIAHQLAEAVGAKVRTGTSWYLATREWSNGTLDIAVFTEPDPAYVHEFVIGLARHMDGLETENA